MLRKCVCYLAKVAAAASASTVSSSTAEPGIGGAKLPAGKPINKS